MLNTAQQIGGSIGAALLSTVPVELYAADIDPAAVQCARRNVPRVFEGDLFDPLPAVLFDVILCNTPYVPTAELAYLPPEAREWEAPLALDGGGDGLDVQRRVAASVGRWLVPGGAVLVEASAGQAPPKAKPVLEINPQHDLIVKLAGLGEGDALRADAAHLLFDEAQIADGEQPVDPRAFAARLARVLTRALG